MTEISAELDVLEADAIAALRAHRRGLAQERRRIVAKLKAADAVLATASHKRKQRIDRERKSERRHLGID